MFERIKESRREAGEGGFTLIELLVVIIILGILAAVVVFAVGGVGDKGQSASCKIDTRTLRTAEEAALATPNSTGLYLSEQGLKDAGLLSELSTYHDIDLATDSKSFTIKTANDATGLKCGAQGATVNSSAGIY
ncbi:MAG TPA: prepilin-type N-terminal cleavage/methylation domain-containing protein [Acidimicrobiales bacterium]|nr:prepilin-type N-terminal cleavage/methylation domain-containing protein [Acidimicrobiales bacterium]